MSSLNHQVQQILINSHMFLKLQVEQPLISRHSLHQLPVNKHPSLPKQLNQGLYFSVHQRSFRTFLHLSYWSNRQLCYLPVLQQYLLFCRFFRSQVFQGYQKIPQRQLQNMYQQQQIVDEIRRAIKQQNQQYMTLVSEVSTFYNIYKSSDQETKEQTSSINQKIVQTNTVINGIMSSVNLKFDQVDKAIGQNSKAVIDINQRFKDNEIELESRLKGYWKTNIEAIYEQQRRLKAIQSQMSMERDKSIYQRINDTDRNLKSKTDKIVNDYQTKIDLLNKDMHDKSSVIQGKVQQISQSNRKIREKLQKIITENRQSGKNIREKLQDLETSLKRKVDYLDDLYKSELSRGERNQVKLNDLTMKFMLLKQYDRKQALRTDQMYDRLEKKINAVIRSQPQVNALIAKKIESLKQKQEDLQWRLWQKNREVENNLLVKIESLEDEFNNRFGQLNKIINDVVADTDKKFKQIRQDYEVNISQINTKYSNDAAKNKKQLDQLNEIIQKERQIQRWHKQDVEKELQNVRNEQRKIQESSMQLNLNMVAYNQIQSLQIREKIAVIENQIKTVVVNQRDFIQFKDIQNRRCDDLSKKVSSLNQVYKETVEILRIDISKNNTDLYDYVNQSRTIAVNQTKAWQRQNTERLEKNQSEMVKFQKSILYQFQQFKQNVDDLNSQIQQTKNDLRILTVRAKSFSNDVANTIRIYSKQIKDNSINIKSLETIAQDLNRGQSNLYRLLDQSKGQLDRLMERFRRLQIKLNGYIQSIDQNNLDYKESLDKIRQRMNDMQSRQYERDFIFNDKLKNMNGRINRVLKQGRMQLQNIYDQFGKSKKQFQTQISDLNESSRRDRLRGIDTERKLDNYIQIGKRYRDLKDMQIRKIQQNLQGMKKRQISNIGELGKKVSRLGKGINLIGKQLLRNTFNDLMIRSPTFRYKAFTGQQKLPDQT